MHAIYMIEVGSGDHAHKVGLALVKKHFPPEYGLLYWVKDRRSAEKQYEEAA